MPIVNLKSGPVFYRESGAGNPLILLHANPGDSRDFDAIVPALAAKFRVFALDWPGYGSSPAPNPDINVHPDFYLDVLKQVVVELEIHRPILLGNSVGGFVAARYALECPENTRALALVSPGGFTHHNLMTRFFCRLMSGPLAIPPGILARYYLRSNTNVVRQMKKRATQEQSLAVSRDINRGIWRSFADPDHDLKALAANLTLPVLLAFGKLDPLIPASKDGRVARALMPDAVYSEFESGHAPFAELPQTFLATLLAFFKDSNITSD
ncbi:alpha/beta hydrolase fold protein [Oleiphilus messinensis]|uniref:Alpha/beta hydrolase fold protein n=1 Tax=Oleiphilus messinensis TaxID=141451 RepID=A0A1Y0IBE9_9GAMM|nr:alpha/beta hydrolase [Oleiphilus messinensis]ARU57837.1 alpha/beta hydrolase fold protein [Oleiphilus messinensis]